MRQKTVTRFRRRRDAARGRARREDARGRRSARHDGVGDGRASAASATTTVTDDGRDGSASQMFIYEARRFCFFEGPRMTRSTLRPSRGFLPSLTPRLLRAHRHGSCPQSSFSSSSSRGLMNSHRGSYVTAPARGSSAAAALPSIAFKVGVGNIA